MIPERRTYRGRIHRNSHGPRTPDVVHSRLINDDFSLAVSDCKTENVATRFESDDHAFYLSVTEKKIQSIGIFPDVRIVFEDYHFTSSLRMLPSVASSEVNVLPRYCTQSITSGSVPLLRTLRRPSGATRTTLPSSTVKTSPST